jgi:hypothetical protein
MSDNLDLKFKRCTLVGADFYPEHRDDGKYEITVATDNEDALCAGDYVLMPQADFDLMFNKVIYK